MAGALVNLATCNLALQRRVRGPWNAPPPQAPVRRWSDRLPVLGWFGLRRETNVQGRGFWVRPVCVELVTGLLLAGLYFWEVVERGLIPGARLADPAALAAFATANIDLALHVSFAGHALLLIAMLSASLIDIDEKLIPDGITLTGTLAGLTLVAAYPWSLLPECLWQGPGLPDALDFVRLNAPQPWPAALAGFPQSMSLLVALGCWWGWCFALMPRTWILRRGWRQAWIWFWGRLLGERDTWLIAGLGLVGTGLIAGCWYSGSGERWSGLLTALVGLAGGGGLVWAIRIIGAATLKREAMGFGDVTLMAMIGTLLGWQAALMTFFLSPFAALVVGGTQWFLRRDQEIPFGPFLCLAAMVVVVGWASFWSFVAVIFGLGWLVPAALVLCLLAMALMLAVWYQIRSRLFDRG